MTSKRKLGVDLDGVLCRFDKSYAAALTAVTGMTFPVDDPGFPPVWYWERAAGVTKVQELAVWQNFILNDEVKFWQNLAPLEGAHETVKNLNSLAKLGHDVYFLTHRMGDRAKFQTEKWLYNHGMNFPTVILAGDKTPIIRTLGLDFFIDDKIETINDLARVAEEERWWTPNGVRGPISIYLKDAPYNREGRHLTYKIAVSAKDALEQEGLWV